MVKSSSSGRRAADTCESFRMSGHASQGFCVLTSAQGDPWGQEVVSSVWKE